jgi:hypothetical protein
MHPVVEVSGIVVAALRSGGRLACSISDIGAKIGGKLGLQVPDVGGT